MDGSTGTRGPAIRRGRVHRSRNTGSAPRPQWRERNAGTSVGERPRPQWGGAAGTARGGGAGTAPPSGSATWLERSYGVAGNLPFSYTHDEGHTLDLLIKRTSSDIITHLSHHESYKSDHKSFTFKFFSHIRPTTQRSICHSLPLFQNHRHWQIWHSFFSSLHKSSF